VNIGKVGMYPGQDGVGSEETDSVSESVTTACVRIGFRAVGRATMFESDDNMLERVVGT
jgi:hypothetical protein